MDSRRFGRTAKGQAEIAQGGKSLRGKLRTVLFLIDANKPVVDIEQQIKLIGAPVDAIDQLVAGGYVAAIGGAGAPAAAAAAAGAPVALAPAAPAAPLTTEERIANFRVAKNFMNETIVDALGIRAFTFTLKLERCSTVEDLIGLLPLYTEALLKKLDREAVRALVERTRELLVAARG
ncbi:MAG: hypothetical protein U1F10_12800 [Burkholderiales bacterium]